MDSRAQHPTHETLQAYGLGKLDDALAEVVNKHLEDCPDRRSAVAEMAPDTFLGRLQGAQSVRETSAAGPAAPDVAPTRATSSGDAASEPSSSPRMSVTGHIDASSDALKNRDEASLQPGTRIGYFGDYEVLKVLGEGGMGIVYKARQLSLNRPVALKMIKASRFPSTEEVRRFGNEAEAVARLDHTNIVPIYEFGQYEDQHYFSMKLIAGESLDKRLKDYLAHPARAARLMAVVAGAVHHAHQRGILHRDLKPANILIDAEGHPHVTDFGLAKHVEGDSELTQSGAIMGTPAYMAPEQASAKRGAVTTSTDVHGLGAILFALLTGRAPFGGTTIIDVLERVRERTPDSPRKLNSRVPRDLEVICVKCLEKDPRRRYASADALAEDLNRLLSGKPIEARPVSNRARLWMWCRRNKMLAGAASTAVLLLTALAVGSLWAAYHFRRTAEAEQAARRHGERRLAEINYERGRSACEKGDIASGLLCFIECWRAANAAGDPAWARLARRSISAWQPHLPRLMAVFPSDVRFTKAIFSPDGRSVLNVNGATAQIWDVATAAPLGTTTPGGRIWCAAFSPDGRTVVTASNDHGGKRMPMGRCYPGTGW